MSAAAALTRSGALARLAGGALGIWVCARGLTSARPAPPHQPPGDDSSRAHLRTLQALVLAGGGPADYKTLTLISVLAGSNAGAVVAALVKAFDARAVKAFVVTYDFVVADAIRRLASIGQALPTTPDPDPKDAKALVAALYTAGVDPPSGTYDIDDMLDRLVSHRLRVQIMNDVEAKFGIGEAAAFRVIAHALMENLQARA